MHTTGQPHLEGRRNEERRNEEEVHSFCQSTGVQLGQQNSPNTNTTLITTSVVAHHTYMYVKLNFGLKKKWHCPLSIIICNHTIDDHIYSSFRSHATSMVEWTFTYCAIKHPCWHIQEHMGGLEHTCTPTIYPIMWNQMVGVCNIPMTIYGKRNFSCGRKCFVQYKKVHSTT